MKIEIIISILALLIAIISLWLQFRNTRKLYLILSNPKSGKNKIFSLLNAGNKDILITEISLCYKTKDGYSFPSQTISPKEINTLNLAAGKSIVFFPKFDKGIDAIDLEKIEKIEEKYSVNMFIHITWVDYKGIEYEDYCQVFKRIFDSNKVFDSSIIPNKRSHNLYECKKWFN